MKLLATILLVGLGIGWGVNALTIDDDLKAKLDAECFAKYGKDTKGQNQFSSSLLCTMTDEYKEKQKLAKAKAKELEEAKKAEADAIAKAEAEAFAKSPEGKTKKFLSQASSHCMRYTRDSAKFPNKVDFDWMGGNSSNYWMNFNDNGDSRVMIVRTGEMMNGLGMMVPFKSVCKYDFNPEKNSFKMIEFLI